MEGKVLSNLVVRNGLAIVANGPHAPLQIPLVDLPPIFLQWQLASRGTLFHQHMAGGDRVARFDAHLPAVVTISTHGLFQAHTANKGTGLLPREGYIAKDIRAMRALLNKVKDWKHSLRERVMFMSSLYAQPEYWDRRYLGSLGIFQGQTYQNVTH